ncbi:ABC transporter ATP-binding protein [Diaminobutyricimonas sp. LJ205]|uniref:ABC transporter ATP-binding protein n=1 Tax=Diaminobutyricimonas sp. LJ205 TaxID=2683590 RepID=UPI0018DF238B|nr:ABC transporter ATP-binding protein [Diaminobutyricimonas sp. LJ205]
MASSTRHIRVEEATKTYATRLEPAGLLALKPITLDIDAGTFVSIVGPSGCGKSTFMRMVAGLTPISGGRIEIDGTEVREPRNDVGVVFQSPVLLPWKTALENVILPARFAKKNLAEAREQAREYFDLVGLSGFESAYPRELSGGMQQRVGIVRALLNHPKLLLMDEPFGALDAMSREKMNLELLRIWAATSCTVLFITHSIPEAVLLADRVLVMSGRPGEIVDDVEVTLPRPRSLEQINTAEFGRYTYSLRQHFKSEGLD